jgi:hypothetical protein
VESIIYIIYDNWAEFELYHILSSVSTTVKVNFIVLKITLHKGYSNDQLPTELQMMVMGKKMQWRWGDVQYMVCIATWHLYNLR